MASTQHMDLETYRREVLGQKPVVQAKYGNKPVVIDSIWFGSQIEAAYYLLLKVAVKAGDVSYFLRQVPIALPGNTKYVVDFQVFLKSGAVQYIDVKGKQTKEFIFKKKQVEALYPFEIQIVERKEIPSHYIKSVRELL